MRAIPNVSYWLYMFGAWLTGRPEVSGPFSAVHSSAEMAELINEFVFLHGLPEPNFREVNEQHRKDRKIPKLVDYPQPLKYEEAYEKAR